MKRFIPVAALLCVAFATPAVAAGSGTTVDGGFFAGCATADAGCLLTGPGGFLSPASCRAPWDGTQAVVCSGTTSYIVDRTTVVKNLFCSFFWPLVSPFVPWDGIHWETDRGTAVIRPDGSFELLCPPSAVT